MFHVKLTQVAPQTFPTTPWVVKIGSLHVLHKSSLPASFAKPEVIPVLPNVAILLLVVEPPS